MTLPEESVQAICGAHDENLRRVEKALEVTLGVRGSAVQIKGAASAVGAAERLLTDLGALAKTGRRLRSDDLATALRVVAEEPATSLVDFFRTGALIQASRRLVAPRSLNQKRYLRAMLDHELVVSTGPAGTGKTYLAVAVAASALKEQKVRRIVLARPAVEAGEKLGFLPGDLAEKVNPYLRPLYDALFDIIGFDKVSRMLEREVIEVAPLAFMRGRSLNDSFIILDEAQNTTPEQMKMFLTRIGFNSKAVVNGDITQIDLPPGQQSGLKHALQVLRGEEGIAFVRFGQSDVVRHELVQRIVGAYDRWEARHGTRSGEAGSPERGGR
ncbi:MAG: PhoH family protein [Acidobacteriota bacterium]|nr:PhoH family protein [Acidobacteriota bacterium]MDE2922663.1 PhoH family protein [Acidobacteriota bacterium]MDE3265620.1 PhoH family protein [Acidobacteriota bacterium]